MAADNIREIFKTDTVGEFMNKCNWNFGIISRIGGPRGLQGERGETGARGRRGAMIHTVNEPDEMMDYMDVETASEILSTLDVEETENMEDGDVVFFKNGWVCEIGIEDGEIVAREPVFPIIGPQGPQGEQGESTDSLFTNLSGNALLLNRLSLTVGNRIYLPTMDSLNGGLYFAHMTDNGNNNITIDVEKAFINFNQNTLNINSNSGINIGTSSNSQINFSINNGDIMRVENDGLKLYKKVEFMGSTSIPGEIVKGGNKISLYNDKTTFNKEIIVSDGNNTTGIGPGSIQTQAIAISDTGNINTTTNFNWISPTGIFLLTSGTGFLIGRNNGYYAILTNDSTIKMLNTATSFQKPIVIPRSSSLKFTNNNFLDSNTNETNTGDFGQMDFSTDGINILYNTHSTTPITNRIIVRNNRTTFYKPIEISVISANQPTATPVVQNDYQNRTAKIEYKYNQSDGSYLNIDKPVKAIVNGESVFLGVPTYTMMTYPDTLPAPQGWERFEDNLILFTDGTSHDATSFNINAYNDSDSNFYIYYNDGETTGYQRIIAVSTLPSDFDAQPSNSQKISYNSTPKNTTSSKESMSEVLNMSSKLNITENGFDTILTFVNTNDKGVPGGGTTPTIPVYENLLRKIFRDRHTNTYEFGMGKIASETQFAFYFPMPVAPTGFTYIFKTA